MAKTKENALELSDKAIQMLDKNGEVRSYSELSSLLKEIDFTQEVEITGEVLKLKNGEEIKAFKIGEADFKGMFSKEMTKAVRLLTENNETVMAVNSMLVGTLLSLPNLTPVRILCTGKQYNKSHTLEYDTYKVYTVKLQIK